MGALQTIRRAGFSVVLEGGALAVSPASALTPQQRSFLKAHSAAILKEIQAETERKPLTTAQRKQLLDYMAHIDETDSEMIQELLEGCRKNRAHLRWALAWRQRYPESLYGQH